MRKESLFFELPISPISKFGQSGVFEGVKVGKAEVVGINDKLGINDCSSTCPIVP